MSLAIEYKYYSSTWRNRASATIRNVGPEQRDELAQHACSDCPFWKIDDYKKDTWRQALSRIHISGGWRVTPGEWTFFHICNAKALKRVQYWLSADFTHTPKVSHLIYNHSLFYIRFLRQDVFDSSKSKMKKTTCNAIGNNQNSALQCLSQEGIIYKKNVIWLPNRISNKA